MMDNAGWYIVEITIHHPPSKIQFHRSIDENDPLIHRSINPIRTGAVFYRADGDGCECNAARFQNRVNGDQKKMKSFRIAIRSLFNIYLLISEQNELLDGRHRQPLPLMLDLEGMDISMEPKMEGITLLFH